MPRFFVSTLVACLCVCPYFASASETTPAKREITLTPTEIKVDDLTGIVWGKKIRGLQLGIRLEGKRVRFMERGIIQIKIFIRNHSKKPIPLLYSVRYADQDPGWFKIENSDKKPLSIEQFTAITGPFRSYQLFTAKRILKPRFVTFIGDGELRVGGYSESSWLPGLVAPGKYKLTYDLKLEKKRYGMESKYLNIEPWEGELVSGSVEVEALTDENPTASPQR